jgi:hypothetical protein
MQAWVSDWGPLVTLASTVLLLGVTGWYAWLTKRVADASRDAAAHAKTAAEATLASVSAAEATIEVKFRVEPILGSTVGGVLRLLEEASHAGDLRADEVVTRGMLARYMRLTDIKLVCEGATVHVHGCRLDSLSWPQNEDGTHTLTETLRVLLSPRDDQPRRLHRGESMHFLPPERPVGEHVTSMRCTVYYSFDGTESRYERIATWQEGDQRPDQPLKGLNVLESFKPPTD